MKNLVPRVAAVHDLSCVGRCSLTVITPTLSALGVQVCPLPTAVLSSHLGGFSGLEFYDFTGHMPAFFHHWKEEGLAFDSIYSGFLASEKQIDVVLEFIDGFSQNNPLVLVDPVMGDHGKLYSTYTPTMQDRMKALVKKADIITPNFTEACFLLGENYQELCSESGVMEDWLRRLTQMGPSIAVITGVPVASDKIMNIGYDRNHQILWQDVHEYIPVRYPGTGDIYASVLLGSLLHGDSLSAAMQLAANFVGLAIETTFSASTPTREGVLLERALPWLSQTFWQEKNIPFLSTTTEKGGN